MSSKVDQLTYCQAELQDVHGTLLFQEVHEAEKQILLLTDFLQLQLQHLCKGRRKSKARVSTGKRRSVGTWEQAP